MTISGLEHRAQVDGQEAIDAHHQVANAHLRQARYWQEAPHKSPERRTAHETAERSHRAKATALESLCDRIREHPGSRSRMNLLSCRGRFIDWKYAANTGLSQLRASNAYIQLAKRAKDHPEKAEIARQIIEHDEKSLNHTPDAGLIGHPTLRMSISDAKEGIDRANQLFREYRDGEKRRPTSGEASSSTNHH